MSEATPTAAPPPPPPQSDAEKEESLDRMLTRLALADDDRLEPLLSSILPYTISSLSSSSPSVRDLVMKILTHVNRRVKHRLEIGLPMLELWKLYCEANTSPMVRNFCTVYLEMAFERLPDEVLFHSVLCLYKLNRTFCCIVLGYLLFFFKAFIPKQVGVG